MKKVIVITLLGYLGILGYLSWQQTTKPTAPVRVAQPAVTVAVENGTVKNEATVSAKTAYESLQKLASLKKLELKTKQYDFGVFVESIGGVANTKDLAWIYFVNGKSGDVAADKANLKNGDKVEWKYTKPIF